jgi:hypothetical protein
MSKIQTILVPEGKVLHVPAGRYTYTGPCEVKTNWHKKWPSEYTDGTKLVFKEEKRVKPKEDAKPKVEAKNESVKQPDVSAQTTERTARAVQDSETVDTTVKGDKA